MCLVVYLLNNIIFRDVFLKKAHSKNTKRMDILSRLNISNDAAFESSRLVFEVGCVQVYSNLNSTAETDVYEDVCGYLIKSSDIVCARSTGPSRMHKPCTRDELRSAIVDMHASSPLKPTEESASLLYRTLAGGTKKKKSRGKRDEDEEEEEEDDDEEVLRIVRKKDAVSKATPLHSSKNAKLKSKSSSLLSSTANAESKDEEDEKEHESEEDEQQDDEDAEESDEDNEDSNEEEEEEEEEN